MNVYLKAFLGFILFIAWCAIIKWVMEPKQRKNAKGNGQE